MMTDADRGRDYALGLLAGGTKPAELLRGLAEAMEDEEAVWRLDELVRAFDDLDEAATHVERKRAFARGALQAAVEAGALMVGWPVEAGAPPPASAEGEPAARRRS